VCVYQIWFCCEKNLTFILKKHKPYHNLFIYLFNYHNFNWNIVQSPIFPEHSALLDVESLDMAFLWQPLNSFRTWKLNWGQTISDKIEVLLGTSCEHDGNTWGTNLKKTKNSLPQPPTKSKTWADSTPPSQL
jgi:hypothetical protein